MVKGLETGEIKIPDELFNAAQLRVDFNIIQHVFRNVFLIDINI